MHADAAERPDGGVVMGIVRSIVKYAIKHQRDIEIIAWSVCSGVVLTGMVNENLELDGDRVGMVGVGMLFGVWLVRDIVRWVQRRSKGS